MAESQLHRLLSEMALTWVGARATQRGVNGNIEVSLRPGYCADAVALCRWSNAYERELICRGDQKLIRDWNKVQNNQKLTFKQETERYPDYIFVFESKATVADFNATFKYHNHKASRMDPAGNFHFIVTPKGMIDTSLIPGFWGHLELSRNGQGLTLKKWPDFCETETCWTYQVGYQLLRCHFASRMTAKKVYFDGTLGSRLTSEI